jgi:membrane protein
MGGRRPGYSSLMSHSPQAGNPEGPRDAGNPEPPTANQGPTSPAKLGARSWWAALKRTVKEARRDNITDWAAALTYYGMLSIFPGLLVLISAVGLAGPTTTDRILNSLTGLAPGPTRDLLRDAVRNLQQGHRSTAGVLAIVGVLGALWSASGYVGAFMRASNAIFDVPEARPVWKKLPIRVGITILSGVLVIVIALTLILTGALARKVGHAMHLGNAAVTAWDIAKWPVVLVLISLLFALLYWASPNARTGGFRWVSPGGLLAVLVWIIVSVGFALYVVNFGSYNRTYGSLAAVIVFLVWLWLSNVAVLLGAEFDAELQRSRAERAGHPAAEEPYIDLREPARTRRRRGFLHRPHGA